MMHDGEHQLAQGVNAAESTYYLQVHFFPIHPIEKEKNILTLAFIIKKIRKAAKIHCM